MNRSVCLGGLVVLIGSLLSAPVAAADDLEQKRAQEKAKLKQGGTWTGRIAALEKDDVSFAFQTEIVIAYVKLVPIRNAQGRIIGFDPRRRVHREDVRMEVWLPAEVTILLPPKPAKGPDGRPIPAPGKQGRPAAGVPGTIKDLRWNQQVQVTLQRDRHGHLFAKSIRVLRER
jgi:hypothetical protein